MMKKLAVTVFAFSLAALGCGSDDGGKKDAAPKLDTQPPGAEVQVIPDAPVKLDTQQPGIETGQPDKPVSPLEVNPPDVPAPIDVAIDQPALIDGPTPKLDGGSDAPAIDGGAIDTSKTEAATAVDSGVDGGRTG